MRIVSDNIFTKTKGNALTRKEFADFISKNEIDEFYIAGADATACVKSICYNINAHFRKQIFPAGVIKRCHFHKNMLSFIQKNKQHCAVFKANRIKTREIYEYFDTRFAGRKFPRFGGQL